MNDHDTGAAPARGLWSCGLMPYGFAALQAAQYRNLGALIFAGQTAIAGYQAVYARLVERSGATMAETRDRLQSMNDRPIDAESAARSIDAARDAFDRGLAELRTVNDMARTATADAFDILRIRTEEAMAELRRPAEHPARA